MGRLEKFLRENKTVIISWFVFLLIFDLFIYFYIFQLLSNKEVKVYFLKVGQGDSQLIILPRNVKVLIDGGPLNGELLKNLEKVLPFYDRYFDLVINSHPQLDHFGGLIDLFQRYKIGYFISNGDDNLNNIYYQEFKKIIDNEKIKNIVLTKGDKIIYGDSYFDIIWPDKKEKEIKDLNDRSLVLFFQAFKTNFLFTGDIGVKVEKELLKFFQQKIDVLKVAHHGSKYSNSLAFLKQIEPKISIIEVGKNSYGHPANLVLNNLNLLNSRIFRTDNNGVIKIILDNERVLKIFKDKN